MVGAGTDPMPETDNSSASSPRSGSHTPAPAGRFGSQGVKCPSQCRGYE